jgi:broad specificity phosphatase PhoE
MAKEGLRARLWLVRHGESAAQTGEELSIDSNLSALGRMQAARLQDVFARIRFDAVFISPLKRARQTYEASGARLAPDGFAEFDTRIAEDMQSGGYLPILPYGELPGYAARDRHDAWDRPTLERVDEFYRDVERLSRDHCEIAVFAHAMVVSALLNRFMDAPVFRHCSPGNASVSIIERRPDSARFDELRLWNGQAHLAGLPGFAYPPPLGRHVL